MARFEMRDIELAVAGGQSRADVFCNLGPDLCDRPGDARWTSLLPISG